MNVIYTDGDLVVAEKPVGVSSQESAGPNMISLLRESVPGDIFPVHRLDTATGGVMVYARTAAAAAALSAQIARREFRKSYHALVYGGPEPPEGELSDLLFHDRQRNKTFVVRRKRNGVKEASLVYETRATGELGGRPVTLLSIEPRTGRTHQIRVQFANIGCPLVGDGKYGARDNHSLKLFCSRIAFAHPRTGEELSFSLPCPFDGEV